MPLKSRVDKVNATPQLCIQVQERTKQEIEREENLSDLAVSSQCTEVCGTNHSARSCLKICLVEVYKKGQSEHAVNIYAILDNQSNHSFRILSLRTCTGVMEMMGKKAHGFQIEASSGDVSIDLPSLI